jgi:hypothetical protein
MARRCLRRLLKRHPNESILELLEREPAVPRTLSPIRPAARRPVKTLMRAHGDEWFTAKGAYSRALACWRTIDLRP